MARHVPKQLSLVSFMTTSQDSTSSVEHEQERQSDVPGEYVAESSNETQVLSSTGTESQSCDADCWFNSI